MSAEDILAAQMSAPAGEVGIDYGAFTATPKMKAMELFGARPDPSHCKQGRGIFPRPSTFFGCGRPLERFILEVLQNYTSYQLAFKLAHNGKG